MARISNIPIVDRALGDLSRKFDEFAAGKAPPVLLPFGATDISTSASDRYLEPGYPAGAASVTEAPVHMPREGKITGISVYIASGAAAAADRRVQFVLRVNGKDTALVAETTLPKFTGVLRPKSSVSVPVKRDDLLSLVVRKDGALTTGTLASAFVEFEG
jgi:hypothetical protein